MLCASRWLLILGGFWLVFDAVLIILRVPNPLFGWPLPCPITLLLVASGLVLFAIGSKAFKRSSEDERPPQREPVPQEGIDRRLS